MSDFLVEMRASLMEINAGFCHTQRAANSMPGLPDVVLEDLDEHLMTRHWPGQVINLFRQ